MSAQPGQSGAVPWGSGRVYSELWEHALDGLPVIVFIPLPPGMRDLQGYPVRGSSVENGEVTGVERDYVWVMLVGEDEPRRVYWTEVRPA